MLRPLLLFDQRERRVRRRGVGADQPLGEVLIDPEALHLFHDGQSLLYRDGAPTTPMRWTQATPDPVVLTGIIASPPVG